MYEVDEDREPTGPLGLADEPPTWDPSNDQKAVYDGIREWYRTAPTGTTTLGGLGGTGKSFLLGKLAYDLLKEGVSVKFAAPTGRAALVAQASLRKSGVYNAEVTTIHRLIYRPDSDPETGRIRGWIKRFSIEADLIVLDEASMVSQEMVADLEAFGVPILAIGDHGQLPPVGEEAGLLANPDFRLEKIHRQAKGNPIIRLCTWARNGAKQKDFLRLIKKLDDDRLVVGSAEEAIAWGKPPGMVISYTNRTRSDLNMEMREQLYGYDDMVDPQVGEAVICLKNHKIGWDEDSMIIANGMRGEIKAAHESRRQHNLCFDIEFDEPVGVVRYLNCCTHQFLHPKTFAGFTDVPGDHKSFFTVGALMDFGYAATCHKAQGSQFDSVAVVLERALDFMSNEEYARWTYTAFSRASERLMIVKA